MNNSLNVSWSFWLNFFEDAASLILGCFDEVPSFLKLFNSDTSKVTDMSCMFYECSSLTEINYSDFNAINVIKMTSMFEKCSNLENLNIYIHKFLYF